MLTLTFAGDESGDVSFSFGKGASRYFVVAVIATAAPESLRQLLADVRERSGLVAHYEFSFNTLSSAPLRRRTFEALAGADLGLGCRRGQDYVAGFFQGHATAGLLPVR